MKFEEFKLHDQLLEGLGYMGFEDATPIQEAALPKILAGHDLIGCAQTGTGKTAAFILPILHKLAGKKTEGLNTLVICPTRELAIQIEQQIQGFAYFTGASSLAIYGGEMALIGSLKSLLLLMVATLLLPLRENFCPT